MAIWGDLQSAGIEVDSWGNDLAPMARRAERDNLWYVGYALTHFLHGGLSLFPSETLAVNIGMDGSGTNSLPTNLHGETLIDKPVPLPETWPEPEVSPHLARAFARYFDYPVPGPIDRLRISLGRWRAQLRN